MEKGMNIQVVKQHYEQMTDQELIRIATEDARGLTSDAVEILKTEIRKRGLTQNIVHAVNAQNKTYTLEEVDRYCDLISNLSCPSCGSSNERLNATVCGEVMSFVLITHYTKKLKVACPSCLDSANNKALATTALLGWWGIPWGIIRSIQYITLNLKNKRTNHTASHNNFLRSFALGNMGILEAHKGDKDKLRQILLRHNAS